VKNQDGFFSSVLILSQLPCSAELSFGIEVAFCVMDQTTLDMLLHLFLVFFFTLGAESVFVFGVGFLVAR
jgi:hypothetical protein